MRGWLWLLLLAQLWGQVVLRGTARGQSRDQGSNDITRKVSCPSLRFRRRGCTSRYECKTECKDKVKCQFKYQYKCTDYRRQECKDKWQNQCNGKKRGKRSLRTRRPPYWLDPSNTLTVDDLPPPSDPSDLPLATPGVGGQIFQFNSPPKSKQCWQKVRTCEYKKYKTTCGNKRVKTCDDKPTKECKKRCKNVYYCQTCPPTKPTTRPTTRPTKRPIIIPRPPVGPQPPGTPPPSVFIISPPAPPPNTLDVVIDAKRKRRKSWRNKP